MFANVFTKTLYDLRRSTVGWSIGLAVLIAVIAALWPSVRSMPQIEEFLAQYPAAMQELFDIASITTGRGFMNAELFTMMLPALMMVYGIGHGTRLVAGEERDGLLEAIVVTPRSRTRILLEKAAALGVVLFASVLVASAVGDMAITVGEAAVGSLAMILIGLLHGWLAVALGAATGRRTLALVLASGIAVGGYVLHVAGALVDGLARWQAWSPFTQAVRDGPLGGALPIGYLWLAIAAVVVLAASLLAFARRDLQSR